MTAYAILGTIAGVFGWAAYAADRWVYRVEDAAAKANRDGAAVVVK